MDNKWKEFKDFINANGEEGAIFSRSGLRKALSSMSYSTIDMYRQILQAAGFFESSGRGQYRLLRTIPTNITWDECSLLRKHKNLEYLESVNKRNIKIAKRKKVIK